MTDKKPRRRKKRPLQRRKLPPRLRNQRRKNNLKMKTILQRRRPLNILSLLSLLQASPSTNGRGNTPTTTLMSHLNGSGSITTPRISPSGV